MKEREAAKKPTMDEKKVREAIEDLKELAELLQNKESSAVEHCNTAIEALEKQLPKKPTLEGDGCDQERKSVLIGQNRRVEE
mgnify:CR=1 FL=1